MLCCIPICFRLCFRLYPKYMISADRNVGCRLKCNIALNTSETQVTNFSPH